MDCFTLSIASRDPTSLWMDKSRWPTEGWHNKHGTQQIVRPGVLYAMVHSPSLVHTLPPRP